MISSSLMSVQLRQTTMSSSRTSRANRLSLSILRIYHSPSLTGNPCNSCRLSVRYQFPLQWDSVHAVGQGDEKRCGLLPGGVFRAQPSGILKPKAKNRGENCYSGHRSVAPGVPLPPIPVLYAPGTLDETPPRPRNLQNSQF